MSLLELPGGKLSRAAICNKAAKALCDTYGSRERNDCSLANFVGRSSMAPKANGGNNVFLRKAPVDAALQRLMRKGGGGQTSRSGRHLRGQRGWAGGGGGGDQLYGARRFHEV